MSSKLDERVLVVPSAELDRLGRFQGFSPEADRYLSGLLVPELIQFLPPLEGRGRPGFQADHSRTSCSDAATPRFVTLAASRRARPGCIACDRWASAGHVSEEDAEGRKSLEAYESAMRREIDEEVEIKSPGRVFLGSGSSMTTQLPSGRFTSGVVHLFELEHPRVLPREEGLAEAEFLPLSAVWEIRNEFETWSQICVESFLKSGVNSSG